MSFISRGSNQREFPTNTNETETSTVPNQYEVDSRPPSFWLAVHASTTVATTEQARLHTENSTNVSAGLSISLAIAPGLSSSLVL